MDAAAASMNWIAADIVAGDTLALRAFCRLVTGITFGIILPEMDIPIQNRLRHFGESTHIAVRFLREQNAVPSSVINRVQACAEADAWCDTQHLDRDCA